MAIDFRLMISGYEAALALHGPSHHALLDPKGRQSYRFAALTAPILHDGFTVLDYGCGLGDLKTALDQRFASYVYEGVDVVGGFVNESARRFPDCRFSCIADVSEIDDEYDFIVAAGVFNIMLSSSRDVHKAYVEKTIAALFDRCRIALCVDFMRADVDFVQEDAYHQDAGELTRFASSLTRRFLVDQSYLPYEMALIAFKEQDVIRPANVFQAR